MTKQEYIKMLQGKKMPMRQPEKITVPTVTDPSFAQSGRDMIFNPIGYETKPIYANGVPLDQMQPFDRMYADKHEAFQSAKELNDREHANAKKWKEEQEQQREQQNQNETTD